MSQVFHSVEELAIPESFHKELTSKGIGLKAMINHKIYIFGLPQSPPTNEEEGESDEDENDSDVSEEEDEEPFTVDCFDMDTREWSSIPLHQEAKDIPSFSVFSQVVSVNEKIYLIGMVTVDGQPMASVHEFIPETATFELIYKKANCRSMRTALTVADHIRNRIYMVGGTSVRGYKHDVIYFDIVEREWHDLASIPYKNAYFAQSGVFWKSQYIVCVGGFETSCSSTSDILLLDVESKEWKTLYHHPQKEQDEDLDIYPKIKAGVCLISDHSASKLGLATDGPQQNTLFVYGGRIECILMKDPSIESVMKC